MLYAYNNIAPIIDTTAVIAPNATIIGNVEIGANSVVLFGAIIRAENCKIKIGEHTIIEDNVIIHGNSDIEIGNYVLIQHNSCIHGCKIQDNVLIGTNCTISDNVLIQKGAMVLNNTVVYPEKTLKPFKKYWSVQNKLKTKFTANISSAIIERNKKHITNVIIKTKKYLASLKAI